MKRIIIFIISALVALTSLYCYAGKYEITEDKPTPLFRYRYEDPLSKHPREIHFLGSLHTYPFESLSPVVKTKVTHFSTQGTPVFFETDFTEGFSPNHLALLQMPTLQKKLEENGIGLQTLQVWDEVYHQSIIPSTNESYQKAMEGKDSTLHIELDSLRKFLTQTPLHPLACLEALSSGLSWSLLFRTDEGMDAHIASLFDEEMFLETHHERLSIVMPTHALESSEVFSKSMADFLAKWSQPAHPSLTPIQTRDIETLLYQAISRCPLSHFGQMLSSLEYSSRILDPENLSKRNILWESRLLDFMAKDPTASPLVVCGVGHLGGDQGLLKLLHNRFGGTVSQIYDRQTTLVEEKTTLRGGKMSITRQITLVSHSAVERAQDLSKNPVHDFISQFTLHKLKQDIDRIQKGLPPVEGLILRARP